METNDFEQHNPMLLRLLQTARKIHNFAWQYEIATGKQKRLPLIEDTFKPTSL